LEALFVILKMVFRKKWILEVRECIILSSAVAFFPDYSYDKFQRYKFEKSKNFIFHFT